MEEAATAAQHKAEKASAVGLPDEGVAEDRKMPEHEVACTAEGTPEPKAQLNFTDAESRIMKTGQGFVQGYNAQVVVDEKHHVIVALGVGNLSPDSTYAAPMMTRAVEEVGAWPAATTMDTGYWSEANADALSKMGLDVYIATGRDKHSGSPTVTNAVDAASATSPKARMTAKVRTAEGRRIYSRRKATVEPVFGRIKEALRFRRFSMRGIVAARAEWSLVCAVHNMLKVFTFAPSSVVQAGAMAA